MWKLVLKLFLIVIVIQNVLCTSKQKRYDFDITMCHHLADYISSAEHEASEEIKFMEYLSNQSITITEDQPGFHFFGSEPMNDKELRKNYNAHVAELLSERLKDMVFSDHTPAYDNLNPLLDRYTPCVRRFFDRSCCEQQRIKCDKKFYYQTIDGKCNNPQYPKNGAAFTPFTSLVYQYYYDSIQCPRLTYKSNKKLPSARQLIKHFFDDCKNRDIFIDFAPSMGAMMFGQLIAHDVSLKPIPQVQSGGPGISCCAPDGITILPQSLMHPYCDPIKVSKSDDFFGAYNVTCLNFVRTQTVLNNDCKLTSRMQLNKATSFLDLSNIYGTNNEKSNELREFFGGKLKLDMYRVLGRDANNAPILNDVRMLQTPILTLLHSLFIREHNRVADLIKKQKPTWTDSNIFWETRRWVIAKYQSIVFNEWLPIFVGKTKPQLKITDYNPTTTNEFSHSAFRFLHHYIPEKWQFFDKYGQTTDDISLSNSVGRVDLLQTRFDDIARALFYQKTNFNGCKKETINRLFKNHHGVGIDLLSIDLQRGRDHGIAPYYVYVEMCTQRLIRKFDDLYPVISYQNIDKLKKVYESVFDVDLYVGSIVEERRDSFYGPTVTCIVNDQFERYRKGDVYFYDNPKNPYPFTPEQLLELDQSTFARILCDNTELDRVPKHVFFAATGTGGKNEIIDCNKIPSVNILY